MRYGMFRYKDHTRTNVTRTQNTCGVEVGYRCFYGNNRALHRLRIGLPYVMGTTIGINQYPHLNEYE